MTATERQRRHQAALIARGGAVTRFRLQPETVAALAAIRAQTGESREAIVNRVVVAAFAAAMRELHGYR